MMLDSTGIRILASDMDQELTTVSHQGDRQKPVTPDTVCNATQHEAATPVRFEHGDSANPINWSKVRGSLSYKASDFVMISCSLERPSSYSEDHSRS